MDDIAEKLGRAQPLQILEQPGDIVRRGSAITGTAHRCSYNASAIKMEILPIRAFLLSSGFFISLIADFWLETAKFKWFKNQFFSSMDAPF